MMHELNKTLNYNINKYPFQSLISNLISDYVCKNIKFTHYGSQSVDSTLSEKYSLNRSWHYSWSKFYYFKKNFNYFFAIRKIFPNFIRSIKKMIISKICRKEKEYQLHKFVIKGILSSISNNPSSYRPFETNK